jgi:hypothetical protein
MTDIHDDFLRVSARLLNGGALSVDQVAIELQRQYRDGFRAGRKDEANYELSKRGYTTTS